MTHSGRTPSTSRLGSLTGKNVAQIVGCRDCDRVLTAWNGDLQRSFRSRTTSTWSRFIAGSPTNEATNRWAGRSKVSFGVSSCMSRPW